jgi:hypothetical protein
LPVAPRLGRHSAGLIGLCTARLPESRERPSVIAPRVAARQSAATDALPDGRPDPRGLGATGGVDAGQIYADKGLLCE